MTQKYVRATIRGGDSVNDKERSFNSSLGNTGLSFYDRRRDNGVPGSFAAREAATKQESVRDPELSEALRQAEPQRGPVSMENGNPKTERWPLRTGWSTEITIMWEPPYIHMISHRRLNMAGRSYKPGAFCQILEVWLKTIRLGP